MKREVRTQLQSQSISSSLFLEIYPFRYTPVLLKIWPPQKSKWFLALEKVKSFMPGSIQTEKSLYCTCHSAWLIVTLHFTGHGPHFQRKEHKKNRQECNRPNELQRFTRWHSIINAWRTQLSVKHPYLPERLESSVLNWLLTSWSTRKFSHPSKQINDIWKIWDS